MLWFAYAVLAVSVGLMIANGVLTWLAWRRWRHAKAADVLLTQLALRAIHQRYAPVWQAWSRTMGTITISAERKKTEE